MPRAARRRPGRQSWLVLLAAAVMATTTSCNAGDGPSAARPSHSPATASGAQTSPTVAAQRIHVGSKPCGVLVGPSMVWVSNYADGTLVAVDRATGVVRTTVDVGSQPCGLARDAGSVWVEDYGSSELTRVDERTGRVLATVDVGAS